MDRFIRCFIILALIFSVVGCTSKEEKAKEVASSLLDAYTSHDYDAASEVCSQQLGEVLQQAKRDFEALEEDYKEILRKEANSLQAEIGSAYVIGESDTVVVCYNLIKNGCDTAKCHLKVVEDKVIAFN